MAKILYSIIAVAAICLTSIDALIKISEKYYISESNETFIHALSDCKLVGMDLARVENASAYTSLVNVLSTVGVSMTNLYWVGGVHRDGESWVWVESGQYFNYTNWGPTEPKYSSTGDFCLQLGMDYGTSSIPWLWEAQLCSLERYYICQGNGYYS